MKLLLVFIVFMCFSAIAATRIRLIGRMTCSTPFRAEIALMEEDIIQDDIIEYGEVSTQRGNHRDFELKATCEFEWHAKYYLSITHNCGTGSEMSFGKFELEDKITTEEEYEKEFEFDLNGNNQRKYYNGDQVF